MRKAEIGREEDGGRSLDGTCPMMKWCFRSQKGSVKGIKTVIVLSNPEDECGRVC